MENNVVTLETAKKLKAAEFPQKHVTGELSPAGHYWPRGEFKRFHTTAPEDATPAPTAQEIADQLPDFIKLTKTFMNGKMQWELDAQDIGDQINGIPGDNPDLEDEEFDDFIYAPTMAEALAALWLKLNQPGQEKK